MLKRNNYEIDDENILIEDISRQDYLKLLSKQYPTIAEASTEIINLEAILNLPKGTEHFLSDIHGEYEPFIHVLRNGSGVIKRKIDDIFGTTLMESERKSLATLVYYPEQKLEVVLKEEKNIKFIIKSPSVLPVYFYLGSLQHFYKEQRHSHSFIFIFACENSG